MRKLKVSEILELSKRKGVKGISAQYFLTNLDGRTAEYAKARLSVDAEIFKWNKETRKAIMAGIKLATKEKDD